jgi:hypothetical protein
LVNTGVVSAVSKSNGGLICACAREITETEIKRINGFKREGVKDWELDHFERALKANASYAENTWIRKRGRVSAPKTDQQTLSLS